MKIILKRIVSEKEAELTAQLAKLEAKKAELSGPKKPPRLKSDECTLVLSAPTPDASWMPKILNEAKFAVDVDICQDVPAHRIDISPKAGGWRIMVMSMENAEFCINLYCNFGLKGHNTSILKAEHICYEKLLEIFKFIYNSIKIMEVV
jgi:hypothetical protein